MVRKPEKSSTSTDRNGRSVAAPALAQPAVESSARARRFDLVPVSIHFLIHREATPRWRTEVLQHHGMIGLVYAVDGKASYTCRGEQRSVTAGDMLLFDREVIHSGAATPDGPFHFYAVLFELEPIIPGDGDSLRAMSELPWHVSVDNRMAVEALFAELDSRWVAKEDGYELRCRAILMTLLHTYIESATRRTHSDPHTEKLMRIARYLQEHHTRTFQVSELAARAGLSESRFRVLFKRTLGMSVVKYQNVLKVNRAQSLLLSGEHSVSETSKIIGISDVYYFSRMFKKITGMNPSSLIPTWRSGNHS